MPESDFGNATRAIADHHICRLDTMVAAGNDRIPMSVVLDLDAMSSIAAAKAIREQAILDPYVAVEASDRACLALRNIFDSVADLGEIKS